VKFLVHFTMQWLNLTCSHSRRANRQLASGMAFGGNWKAPSDPTGQWPDVGTGYLLPVEVPTTDAQEN
jgi:hypothetical protein